MIVRVQRGSQATQNPRPSLWIKSQFDCFVALVAGGFPFPFLHARSAACTSTGCPPITLTDFTVRFGATRTSSLTMPFTFMARANSGYTGTTRLVTLLVVSEEFCCAPATAGTNSSVHKRNRPITTLDRDMTTCPLCASLRVTEIPYKMTEVTVGHASRTPKR